MRVGWIQQQTKLLYQKSGAACLRHFSDSPVLWDLSGKTRNLSSLVNSPGRRESVFSSCLISLFPGSRF